MSWGILPNVANVIGEGVLKVERIQIICPACGQQVEAVATDGRVKGYCAVTQQYVDFLVETKPVRIGKNPTAESKAKMSAAHTGKHLTAETKAKMSATHTGKHPTAETKAKLSAATKKYWQDPEHRARQSGAQKGVQRKG